jgi:hypothetical protein
MRIFISLVLLSFFAVCSNPVLSDSEKATIPIIIVYKAVPPTGFPPVCIISVNNTPVKTFLSLETDTLDVMLGSNLHAEYYGKYSNNNVIVKDTIATKSLIWTLN